MKTVSVLVMIICVGSSAAGSGAAEPDVVWPAEWTAFGPYTITRMGLYGEPEAADLLSGETLATIPAVLAIGDERLQGLKLRLGEGALDLDRRMPPGAAVGVRAAYLMAPITAVADTTIQIGAGADWWMQWWLDGQPVYSTLGKCGNGATPITGRDHVFDVTLSRGRHVLAVAVIGNNNGSFALAITSPKELRANTPCFKDAIAAGKRRHSRPHWSVPMDLAGARQRFQQAVPLAATDEERAEALLAAGDSGLRDIEGLSAAQAAEIRREYGAVMTLEGARARQKARAALGIGETWLLENNLARAREAFAWARGLSDHPGWASTVQFAMARACLQEKKHEAARTELAQLTSGSDLEAALQFDARLHLAALELASRIRPDHPRLFFNADTWPEVETRVMGDTEAFDQLQREVGALPEAFDVMDWGRRQYVDGRSHADLMMAALVYRVTGDAALLRKIRRMLKATVDHYVARADFNAHVESRVRCVAALDWVWNDLRPTEREGLVHDLLRHAYGRHVQDMLYGVERADRDSYYYMPMMHWYVGLAALNPDMDAVDYMRALALLGRGYENHVRSSFGARIELMKDRGRVTRVDYALKDLPTPCWTFLHSWRSAVGAIPDEWTFASGIAPSYVLREALDFGGMQPAGGPGGCFRHFGYAHSWNPKGGWTNGDLLYDNLGQFIHFFAKSQPEEAAIAAYLRQEMEEAGCVGRGHYLILPYVTDLSGAPPPKLPEGLPLARHYPSNGLVLMSSGFDPGSSTYALYACGGGAVVPGLTPAGEEFDTGHFTIYKKGYLALDSGTRALWADPRPAGAGNYDSQSVAHNTVLIRMPDEVMPPLWRLPVVNSGGQCKLPVFAGPLAFETDPRFAYAATDATETYHPGKCAQMVRQFLYLPPDHFVVFDRVISKRSDYPKTWLLHTANEPAVAGNEFRADQDQGRIFCRTLYPPDAVLEKIGGPGKEFWADGKNWPIPANSRYLRTMGMTDASDVPENVGRWRVEVKPGAARTRDLFLHLIQVSDQTAETMVESLLSDKRDQIELAFTSAARTFTIVVNKTGDVGGHIRINEGEKVLVDRALTREVMPQSGLARVRQASR